MQKPKASLIERLIHSVRAKNLLSEAHLIAKDLRTISVGCEIPENTVQLYNIIMVAAAASADFRAKVFSPGYPETSGKIIYNIGYMNSEMDLSVAMRSGFYNANVINDYIDKYCNLEEGDNILDFGCGSLRVSRYLMQFSNHLKYSGCDVNPFSIKWAQDEFLDRAQIFLMDSHPPLILTDASMHLIFGWSIFSHYSEDSHKKWLAELHRILRNRGYLLVSIQGDHLINQMISGDRPFPRSEKVDIAELYRAYHDTGFGFYKCFAADKFGFDVQNVGMSFISEDYIRRNWTKMFEIVRIDPAAVGNSQDVILLRKL